MSFTNVYYKRTAGTPKPCFVCYKPTTTVLATLNTVDFIYSCETHLSDPGFAQLNSAPASPPAVSQEDVGKAIAEWEDRQKAKKEKLAEAKKDDDKDKDKPDDSKDKKEDPKPKKDESKPATPKPAATHAKYILHRDIFSSQPCVDAVLGAHFV
ncbi:DUF1742-domain-containing protein [Mycena amicta]|nr:DUF1742-domain-containing protein [Mycena amicta]